jgi:hypothetical protein
LKEERPFALLIERGKIVKLNFQLPQYSSLISNISYLNLGFLKPLFELMKILRGNAMTYGKFRIGAANI